MRSRRSRILLSLALLLALGGGFLLGAYKRYVVPIREFQHHRDQVEQMILGLMDSPPPRTSDSQWEAACQACQIGIGNALYFPSTTPVAEVTRLEADLRDTLERHPEPDVQTLIWFWERMGECSWSAKKYVVQFRPWFDEHLPPDSRSDQSQTAADL